MSKHVDSITPTKNKKVPRKECKAYNALRNMIKRCHLEGYTGYHSYGGRGIKVCQGWRDDYDAAILYIESLPGWGEPGLTIDRIDNDGNYEPGNLRMATKREQAINRRSSTKVKAFGMVKSATEWSDEYGVVSPEVIRDRLRYGWDSEDAIMTPLKVAKRVVYRGSEYTYAELSSRFGINKTTIKTRIERHGWTVEDAAETPVKR